MFNIERTVMKVKIYGKEFDVKLPTVKEASRVYKDVKGKTEEEGLESLILYISSLGIDRETLENMEHDHFLSLVNFITKGPKEKRDPLSGQ